ncbi:hypothetical protein NYG92_02910 [Campylobacter felis]|uniref:hypothetical protein n=1 Tax=Campylobacter felis TaxID=2974565 RepID=UPI00255FBD61|nr:hypothetical protein [Campylobacter felis]MDL0109719.1 hypothetical protein [Campylobacter felis]
MAQKECVIQIFETLQGVATLGQLYALVDTSIWKTKTPYASIRRIVQTNKEFFKIKPGLWGLSHQKDMILKDLHINLNTTENLHFTHTYYQGIITELGALRGFQTFIPAQDKNKLFINKPLKDIATLDTICTFTYLELINKAKTIDSIWFNERKMPHAFYEVEHSTDFKNSLNKFFELQDFRSKFYIVADKKRKAQFLSIMENSIYKPIKDFVNFADYESIVKQYENESMKYEMGI